jgi:hypothetical protein
MDGIGSQEVKRTVCKDRSMVLQLEQKDCYGCTAANGGSVKVIAGITTDYITQTEEQKA